MITVLCGDESHPVVEYVKKWILTKGASVCNVKLVFNHENIPSGGILFVVSYGRILPTELLDLFSHVIVLHASDLPRGRGWSPYVWELLTGATQITLCAINAAKRVDEGDVWAKVIIDIKPTDIYKEINKKLFEAEIALMEKVLSMIDKGMAPIPQVNELATYYPRRTPENSRVNLDDTIGDIFNLLRIADPQRYPVYFEKNGVRFNLYLEKIDETFSD